MLMKTLEQLEKHKYDEPQRPGKGAGLLLRAQNAGSERQLRTHYR